MLLDEVARELVEVTSSLVGGRTINIMNTDGVIIASTEYHRIGSYHQGAREALRTGKVVNIRKDQLEQYPGAKEGCNMPLRVNGDIIGVVGIYGNPEEIQDVAHLLEVYATKYYQLEAVLRPRISESALRGQLLSSLLSPSNSTMSAAHTLIETLHIQFRFPVYTLVISSPEGMGLRENAERLHGILDHMAFLDKHTDVWGIAEEHMVVLCSHQEGRSLQDLFSLSRQGYRVSMGMPCGSLWEIRDAYRQAVVLDTYSEREENDIRQIHTYSQYLISSTAMKEAAFVQDMHQRLLLAFREEELPALLESIKTYYDCSRSVSCAAQRLYIHKNTLQYRVKRVQEALDLAGLPPFYQEYLIRLVIAHLHCKSGPKGLEK